MPVSSWSTTPASNGSTLGIDIAENCDAANINNALREMMAQLKTKLDAVDTSIDGLDTSIDASLLAITGTVIQFAGGTAPSGYLECNGTAVSRSTYSALFAIVSTTYGAGDSSTTFNLPDLRGEFVRGWDHGRGIDAARALGSTQADSLESHTHGLRVYDRADTDSLGSGGGGDNTVSASSSHIAGYIEATGDSETRPRNLALMMCIKT